MLFMYRHHVDSYVNCAVYVQIILHVLKFTFKPLENKFK